MTSSPRLILPSVLLVGHAAAASHQQPQPGVDLGGPGARQQNLVESPLDVDGDQAALVDDGHHRHRRPRGAQQPAQPAGGGQIRARVDDRHIRGARLQQGGHLRRRRPHVVGKQRQRGQHRFGMRVDGQ